MRRWRTQSAVSPQRPGYATGEYSDDDVARRLNQEVLTCRAAPRCASAPRAYRARTYVLQFFDKDAVSAWSKKRGLCGLRSLRGSDEHELAPKLVEWFAGASTRPSSAWSSSARCRPSAATPLSPQHHARQPGAHLPAHRCARLRDPPQPAARHASRATAATAATTSTASASSAWPRMSGISPTSAPTGSSRRSRTW